MTLHKIMGNGLNLKTFQQQNRNLTVLFFDNDAFENKLALYVEYLFILNITGSPTVHCIHKPYTH